MTVGLQPMVDEVHRPAAAEVVLELDQVSVEFEAWNGSSFHATREVSLTVRRGECLGVVGESGSGKTVTTMAVLGLLPQHAHVHGAIRLLGEELTGLPERERLARNGRHVSMVFQDPKSSLNPVRRVGSLLVEAIRAHAPDVTRAEARDRAVEALRSVGLPSPEKQLRAYPHQLSGGMRQRVCIALALVNEPDLLIADEATTALDTTVQAQILDLLHQRLEQRAMVLVTHNLGVAAVVADQIAVMYGGRVVEHGPTADVLDDPRHPYTKGLLAAAPDLDNLDEPLVPIAGAAASTSVDGICPFADRCSQRDGRCTSWPELAVRRERLVACWQA